MTGGKQKPGKNLGLRRCLRQTLGKLRQIRDHREVFFVPSDDAIQQMIVGRERTAQEAQELGRCRNDEIIERVSIEMRRETMADLASEFFRFDALGVCPRFLGRTAVIRRARSERTPGFVGHEVEVLRPGLGMFEDVDDDELGCALRLRKKTRSTAIGDQNESFSRLIHLCPRM